MTCSRLYTRYLRKVVAIVLSRLKHMPHRAAALEGSRSIVGLSYAAKIYVYTACGARVHAVQSSVRTGAMQGEHVPASSRASPPLS